MKPQYFIAILFVTALYWMYMLYAPYLMAMTIAALLAISTSNIQEYFTKMFHSKLVASFVSSFLLAVLFFAPLGYFLAHLTPFLNTMQSDSLQKVSEYIHAFLTNPPSYLSFLQPYFDDIAKEINMQEFAAGALHVAGKVGSISAGFLKNAFLVIVFYFFAQYNSETIVDFLKRAIQVSVEESTTLINELSSVMSVVFYSILTTAAFEGVLFGIAVSFMGYNGLLFGIMYGFASLIPVVGGVMMWLPFMLYEFSLGNTGSAIFIALYSLIVISIIADTFIKPVIIKEINRKILSENDAKLNELVIFFAILAGLTTFGFWGMILGPAITAFFFTILKLFEARTRECETKHT